MDNELPDPLYLVGQIVDVEWKTKRGGVNSIDCPPWNNKKVIEIRKFGSGETMAILEGHPCCPVRIERLTTSN